MKLAHLTKYFSESAGCERSKNVNNFKKFPGNFLELMETPTFHIPARREFLNLFHVISEKCGKKKLFQSCNSCFRSAPCNNCRATKNLQISVLDCEKLQRNFFPAFFYPRFKIS